METNQDYRQFLTKNAEKIMNVSQFNFENKTLLPKSCLYITSKPYIEVSSDLKEYEIHKQNLNKRINNPLL
tara:strand:+ start:155 stop:367 length:213 start_codon:yes stop_codon:yes gene_type:complete